MNYKLLIDTETISLEKRFVYDIGYIVVDENLKPVTYGSLILSQVYDNKALFETAYYSKKRPLYTGMLKSRKAKKTKVGHAFRTLRAIIKEYEITEMLAYNGYFDLGAMNFTAKFFGLKNPVGKLKVIDIQALANHEIHNTAEYKRYCLDKGFVSQKGYLQVNAEITYNYLYDEPVAEDHVGLNDCFLELEILRKIKDFTPKRKLFFKA